MALGSGVTLGLGVRVAVGLAVGVDVAEVEPLPQPMQTIAATVARAPAYRVHCARNIVNHYHLHRARIKRMPSHVPR